MITISPRAAEQIHISAEQTDCKGMALRIAAKVAVDESIEYGIGFDEEREGDLRFTVQDIDLLIAPSSAEFLHGAHLDFVEVEPGQFNFIFQNPNDPHYKPPKDDNQEKDNDDNKSD
jgi:iron-sulfur cluster assembly protein